jgi:hypothetical protein
MQLANTTDDARQTETLQPRSAAGPIARPVLKCVSQWICRYWQRCQIPLEERTQDRLCKGRVDFRVVQHPRIINT